MKNHNLAYVHPDAKIGENVVIEPFAYIADNVEIGNNTWIGPHAVVMSGARIGSNCRIFPGAVIGAIPQDLKFEGEDSLAIIGNNTTIRECVTVNRGTKASGKTTVGNNCLLMAYAHVAHDCIIGNNCVLANSVNLGGHVEIDDYAILGGMSAVHQFVKIGGHVMLSGGSLVGKDIPPYITAARFPVSYTGLNTIGLRRRGFSNETINHIHDIYRIVFQQGHTLTNAINIIEQTISPSAERDYVLTFIKKATRGLIKGGENNEGE